MSSISFGGIVSGLDTGSIVSQLVALRRQPIVRMENQKTSLRRSLAALDDLKSALSKLDSAAKALDTENEFNSKVGRSSDESRFTAKAGAATPAGVYKISVDRLAQTHREVGQEYASTSDSVGTGTFRFTLDGVTTEIELLSGADTLADLKSKINEADAGVTATIVNNGSGYRLLLSAEEPGLANRFTVDATGLGGGTAPTFTTASLGEDAQITIDDSIVVTGTTNTIAGALEGLEIELESEGVAELTIEGDTTDLASKIQAFSDAYNEVVNLMKSQYEDGGALERNPLVRSVRERLATAMTSRVDTAGTYGIAAEIGLSLDRFGNMTFDKSKLTEAIDNDYASVQQLFTRNEGDGDRGIASAITATVDSINARSNGLIKFRRDAIDDELKRIDSRIERENRSVEIYEQTLNRKFTAMEMALSQMQAQSGFLFS